MVIELSPIRVINKLRGSLIWFSLYNQELQSQTKIVGALRPNAVFFPSRAPLVPLKVVYRGSVTKPCTPTLRGQGDTKVSQQF